MTQPPTAALRGALGQVLLATLASTTGFWAWMSIAPLQKSYATSLGLNEGQISLMLATPVLVGALGRILVGALTDRFGGRKMFTAILLGSVPAVLLVALAGSLKLYWLLIAGGFYLGVAGTVFAIGIPFSSAWYPPEKRGLANGIFGMGMVGTAVSAFLTPRLAEGIGYLNTHFLIAGVMVVVAAVVWFALKESPAWHPNPQPLVPRVVGALKLPITWQMSFLYAIAFGGFVAFSTYLPKYLTTIYPQQVDQIGAGTRLGELRDRSGDRPSDRWGARRPPRREADHRHLAGRHRRPCLGGEPAATGRHPDRRDLPRDGSCTRRRHGRDLRLGAKARPVRQGRLGQRGRGGSRRTRRLLPARWSWAPPTTSSATPTPWASGCWWPQLRSPSCCPSCCARSRPARQPVG